MNYLLYYSLKDEEIGDTKYKKIPAFDNLKETW